MLQTVHRTPIATIATCVSAPTAATAKPTATDSGQCEGDGRWTAAWVSAGGAPRRGPYFSRQNESRPYTGGIVSKSCTGGGDDVRHSSVRPSQGSADAAAPRRRLCHALTMNSSTAMPMPKAPMVEAKLAVVQPTSGGYR